MIVSYAYAYDEHHFWLSGLRPKKHWLHVSAVPLTALVKRSTIHSEYHGNGHTITFTLTLVINYVKLRILNNLLTHYVGFIDGTLIKQFRCHITSCLLKKVMVLKVVLLKKITSIKEGYVLKEGYVVWRINS